MNHERPHVPGVDTLALYVQALFLVPGNRYLLAAIWMPGVTQSILGRMTLRKRPARTRQAAWGRLGREFPGAQFLKCALEGEAQAPGGHGPLAPRTLCRVPRDRSGGEPEQSPWKREMQGSGSSCLDTRVVLALGIPSGDTAWRAVQPVLALLQDLQAVPAARALLLFHFLQFPRVLSINYFSV